MIAIVDLNSEDIDFLIDTIKKSGEKFKLTADEAEIIKSDRIILASSGDTSSALRKLHLLNLFTILRICRKPLLGICLGMQLMGDHTRDGSVSCLGIFPVDSEEFLQPENDRPFKGMHRIQLKKSSPLFSGIKEGEYFYFYNSYYMPVNRFTTSVAVNNIEFSASVERSELLWYTV
jgi:imidazole glycerol-phosphate synthase subunit HisH